MTQSEMERQQVARDLSKKLVNAANTIAANVQNLDLDTLDSIVAAVYMCENDIKELLTPTETMLESE